MNVCLFDIDGTLLSTGGAGKAAMEAGLLARFNLVNLIDNVPYSGRTDRAIGSDLLRLHNVADTPECWQRLVDSYLEHLPTFLASHPGRILPGVSDLLNSLCAGDVMLGLLTGNIREGARLKLGHFGLWEHFSFGGFGDNHLNRDDVAREAMERLVRLIGADTLEQVWVVGDTPLDVRCARAIGARIAAVATGWHSLEELAAENPDLLFRDFSTPEPLLEALRA